MNRKGESDIEKGIILLGGIGVAIFFVVTVVKSGIYNEIVGSLTGVFGPIGGLLAFLFVVMIVVAIFENLKRR